MRHADIRTTDEYLWKSHGKEQARGARLGRSPRFGFTRGLVPLIARGDFYLVEEREVLLGRWGSNYLWR
jgi:hypothetical protein